VCPHKDWFSNFEKLAGCSVVKGDDRPCNMKGTDTVHIKMFDGMVRELKKVRYVPRLKRNHISVGALKTLGLEVYIRDGVLKMTRDLMVVLKDIRSNSIYYLKGRAIIRQVANSTNSDNDCTRFWHMSLGHTGEKSLQALAKKGLLKGVKTCKLNFCKYCVIRRRPR